MMRINIKIKDGKKIDVQINSKENIMKIKNMIEENEYIPVGRQHLIFEGEVLKNNNLLSNYDLKDGSTILLVDTNKSLKSQIKDILKINIKLENVDDLLNESLSYFDEDLDDKITKKLFKFIKSCFSKFADLCIKILDKRLKKKEITSYHLIITASVLQKYFSQINPDIINNYSDFISNSIQDILPQIKDSKNKELNILGYQIPQQYKLDFITDIVLLSHITEQIVVQLSKFFFYESIETEKLDSYIKKVSDLKLLDSIPEKTFIKNNFFLRFPKDMILHFISRSNNQIFQKICSPITNSITEKDEIDSSFSDVFVNKCIYNGLKLENPGIYLNKFTQFENRQFFEYLSQFDIKVPKRIITDKQYIQILFKHILNEPDTTKNKSLYKLMFKFLMMYEFVSTKYILIQLERYTENLLLDPKIIFEKLKDLYNEHKEEFVYVLKTFYGFSQKNNLFIRKLYANDTIKMEMPFFSFTSKLSYDNYKSFVFLQNIISTFPFFIKQFNINTNDGIPLALAISLPFLNCFSIFFEENETNEKLNELKLAVSALSFLISCLYSTEFLSRFVPWLFKNYTNLNESKVIFLTHILFTLFQTRVINKIVLGYAIKYKFLKIISQHLGRKMPDSPFKDYYYNILYKVSSKFIDLTSELCKFDDALFIDQLINDQNENPFETKFDGSPIISDIIINPINFLFNHENNYTKKITSFFKEIGESQHFWIYNGIPKSVDISAFILKLPSDINSTKRTSDVNKNLTSTSKPTESISLKPFMINKISTLELPEKVGFGSRPKLSGIEPAEPAEPARGFEQKEGTINETTQFSLNKTSIEAVQGLNINKNRQDNISGFLKQFIEDESLINEDKLQIPGEISIKMKRYLQSEPKWVINYINSSKSHIPILEYQYKYLEQVINKLSRIEKETLYEKRQYYFENFKGNSFSNILYFNDFCDELLRELENIKNLQPSFYDLINKIISNKNQLSKSFNIEYFIKKGELDLLNSHMLFERLIYIISKTNNNFNKKLLKRCQENLQYFNFIKPICNELDSRIEQFNKDKSHLNIKQLLEQIENFAFIDGENSSRYQIDDNYSSLKVFYNLNNDSKDLENSSPFFRYGIYKKYQELLNQLIQENILNFDTSNFLREYFEIVPFSVRLSYFKNNLMKIQRTENIIHLNVSRYNILIESFNKLSQKNPKDLLCNLKVKFIGENETDSDDFTKEWFTYIVKDFFNPHYALFMKCTDGTYHPNRLSYYNEQHIDYFRFVGEIIALALIKGQFIPAYFSKSFLRQILHQVINFYDLEGFDDFIFRSMKLILETENIEDLSLTFTIDEGTLGELKQTELVKFGENIDVTNENREAYVALYTEYKLRKSVIDQIKAFNSGFNALIPADIIKIFTPAELCLMIHGVNTIDVKDFQAHTKYKSPYTKDHATIQLFFKVISQWSQKDLAKLLQFITGISQISFNAFKDFEEEGNPITIVYNSDCTRLPTANTFFNTLDLPEYETEKDMNEKLLTAVNECNCFGFF